MTDNERTSPVFLVTGLVVGFVVASLTGMQLVAQGKPEAAKIQNPVASSPESISAGTGTFRRYCANCHGINAEGGSGNDLIPPAPDLTDKEWNHGATDGEIFDTIKNGVPPELNMAPWGDQLKDQDIWNVVNYLRSLAKK